MMEHVTQPNSLLLSRQELMSRVRWLMPLARQRRLVGVASFRVVMRLTPPNGLRLDLMYGPLEPVAVIKRAALADTCDGELLHPGEVRLRLVGSGTIGLETERYAVSLPQVAGWLRTHAKGTSFVRVGQTQHGHLTMEGLAIDGTVVSGWQTNDRLPSLDWKIDAAADLLLEVPVRILRQAMLRCAFGEAGPKGRHRRILGGPSALADPSAADNRRPVVVLTGRGECLQVIGEGRTLRPAAEAGAVLVDQLVHAVPLVGDTGYVFDAKLLSHVLDAFGPEERIRILSYSDRDITNWQGTPLVASCVVGTPQLQVALSMSYRRTSPRLGSRPLSIMVRAPTDLIVSVEALRAALAELADTVRAEKCGGAGSILRAVRWIIQPEAREGTAARPIRRDRAKLVLESGVLVGPRRDRRGERLRRRRVRVTRAIPAGLLGAAGAFYLRWSSLDDILRRIAAPRVRCRFFPEAHFVEITRVGGGPLKSPFVARWARVPLVTPRAVPTPQWVTRGARGD